jgi:hypothetical protein
MVSRLRSLNLIGFRIGIDCHRTIINTPEALKRIAKRKYNVSIPADQLTREGIVGRYLSLRTYEDIIGTVITRAVYTLRHVREVPGAIEAITQLQNEGHYVEIVTSSGHRAHEVILRWLNAHHLEMPTRSVGRHALKGHVATDYHVFLDDNVEQVDSCRQAGTPYVFLLTTPTNKNKTTPEGVIRVKDWKEFVSRVHSLSLVDPRESTIA